MTDKRVPVATAAPGTANVALSVAAAACALVLTALPAFLVGGLAVQIRAELGFTASALGAAVSGAFLTGAAAAPLTGRLADRIGARRSVMLGAACSTLALAGIAAGARSYWHLAALLALSGLGFAATDPGLAILLQRGVPSARQGMAFGIKEASIPTASLVAGLAVPAIALTLGWRWAFTLGVIPLAGLAVLLPRLHLPGPPTGPAGSPGSSPAGGRGPARAALLLVAAATVLGISAASGIGVFLTQSAVAMGMGPGSAGLLLATGSVAGIVARVVAGVVADRNGRQQLGVISALLAIGAVAMLVGATGVPWLMVIGTIGVFAAAWGWSGLLFLSLVRASPANPGAAAGVGVAGLAAGNGLGPVLFGLAAQNLSFAVAWTIAAGATAVAAVLMWLARPAFSGRDET